MPGSARAGALHRPRRDWRPEDARPARPITGARRRAAAGAATVYTWVFAARHASRQAGRLPAFLRAPNQMTSTPRVLLSLDEAAAFARAERRAGRRIVFTNGVFDLIHPGHVRYLQAARTEGDLLVVGVNSDRSVRANKGRERPVIPQEERAELLLALACVDAVLVFDEETPDRVIRAIGPDVLVKGADWAHDAIVGRDVVEARGGRVVRAEIAAGYSTTAIIDRVRALPRRS